MAVPKRFGILRLVGNALKVIAWIILVVSVLLAIVVGIAAPVLPTDSLEPLLGAFPGVDPALLASSGLLIGIVTLITGLIYFLVFYAAGENILLRVALEENTRLTAALLLRMHQDSQVEPEPEYGAAYAPEAYQGR